MALLWIDGFDAYGTSTGSAPNPSGIVQRTYSYIVYQGDFVIRAGRLTGYAIDLTEAGDYLGVTGLTSNDTVVLGLAFKTTWPLGSSAVICKLRDGSTTGVNLKISSTGEIAVYCGATLLGTTAGAGLTSNTWYFIELKVKCATTTGTYEVRIGGSTKISGTGTTQAGPHTYHDGFALGSDVQNNVIYDDLYFLDSSGSVNNNLLGNMRVCTLYPNAAGDSTQLTPSSGANYTCVDETICNDDTNYVEDTVSGHTDLYNYGALVGITGGIAGVVVTTDCRETDASSFSLITECKSGTTVSDDTPQALGSTNYITRRRLIELDPNTSAAWTPTAINAIQLGVKVN